MSELKVLQTYKKFIYDVTRNIRLPKQYNPGEKPVLVPPIVVIGWLPHKNLLPDEYDIPAIIVASDTGSDSGDEASLSIRISFAVFNPGPDPKQENESPSADMEGYTDLIYLRDFIRFKLCQAMSIGGITTVQKPLNWGMYEEQPWPYWYGWLKFETSLPPIRFNINEIELSQINYVAEDPDSGLEIPANNLKGGNTDV